MSYSTIETAKNRKNTVKLPTMEIIVKGKSCGAHVRTRFFNGDVYLPAILSSASRSPAERIMGNGLVPGIFPRYTPPIDAKERRKSTEQYAISRDPTEEYLTDGFALAFAQINCQILHVIHLARKEVTSHTRGSPGRSPDRQRS
jgi:hypothetical protein